MILLEYIIAQHQEGDESVAVKSKKVAKANPALFIKRGEKIIWELRGLCLGEKEEIEGEARVTHIDFYIGMEDLIEQRNLFLESIGMSLGLPDGLRNPTGTERAGGKKIKWFDAKGRINIENIDAFIPPFKFSKNTEEEIILNVDIQRTPGYVIISEGGERTTFQVHFGIEHFQVSKDNRISRPKIFIEMSEDQYTTVLSYIDAAIESYQSMS